MILMNYYRNLHYKNQELKNFFKDTDYLLKTIIPRNVRLAEAPSFGKPCLIYDSESIGTKAYLKLAKEILEKDNERGK